jgi:hypothetical protein
MRWVEVYVGPGGGTGRLTRRRGFVEETLAARRGRPDSTHSGRSLLARFTGGGTCRNVLRDTPKQTSFAASGKLN